MDDLFAEQPPIPLDELVTNLPSGPKYPEKVARNEAAYTALMTKMPVENYQTMMAENAVGSSQTMEQIQHKVDAAVQDTQMKSTLEMLGDKTVPVEAKQQLIAGMKNKRATDPKKKFLEGSFMAPSEGELPNETEARLTTAQIFEDIYKGQVKRQAMVDAFAASRRDDVYAESVAEVGIPFAQSKVIASGSKPGVWNTIKGFFMPGSQIKEEQKLYASLPPEGKADYLKNNLLPRLEKMNLVGWGDAHLQQIDYLRAVTEGEEYLGTLGVWGLNLQNVLDAVGMGWSIRSARKAAQGAKAVSSTPTPWTGATPAVGPSKALPEAAAKPAMVQPGDLARVSPGTPTKTGVPAETADKIAALEKEYEGLLGSSSQAGSGDIRKMREELASLRSSLNEYGEDAVKELAKRLQKGSKLSYKEALKEAEKRMADGRTDIQASIVRIESQIASNADAAKVHGRLGEIEKELSTLKKVKPTTEVLRKTAVAQALEKQDEVDRVVLNSIVKQEQPMSPLSAMMQSNPEKARTTLNAIKEDTDGELTKAMTGGNTPEQALIDTLMPNLTTSSGKVVARPAGLIEPDNVIRYMYERTGATALTDAEKAAIHTKIEEGWRNAEGLTIHDGMSGFKISSDGNYADISAVYGTPNGSFLTPEKALEQAEFALRRYGVSRDDITILARDGLDYKPVKLEEVAGKEGDYKLQIEHRQAYSLSDEGLVLEPFTIKRNWFDNSLITAKGDVTRSLFDPASVMDPKIHIPVGAAVDKSVNIDRLFLQLSEAFAKDVKALNKTGQAKVMDYVYMADEYSIKFDPVALKAQGWTDAEVEAVRKWKAFNDNQYFFENEDLIRTLSDQGYMKYVGQSGEDYIAKPVRVIPKDSPIGVNQKVGTYLDPVTGNVEFVTKVDEQMVHAAGGTYAKLRRPLDVNGTRAEYILVRNDPQEYLRAFRPTDTVLAYKDGHFTRYYEKGAKFIDEVHMTGDGKEIFRRAVAVGPDTPSAKHYIDSVLNPKNTNPNIKYVYRDDAKGYVRGSDEWWDIEAAKGRISQKHRGQTLGGFGGVKHFGEGSYIVDPVTSSIRAAQSMGQRMGMRTAMEAAKARIEKQYGHMFPNGRIPATLEEIGNKGQFTGKEVADARASVAYIRNIENGYHNLIDQGYKQLINTMGNFFGEKGFGKAERVIKAGESFNPSAFAKQSVFYSYIVLGNPIRQILLQSSAGLASLVYRPQQWLKMDLPVDLTSYGMHHFGKDTTPFGVFVDEVGILASVHKNNMVSDALSDLATQRGAVGSAVHTLSYKVPLEAGFGMGERINQLFWHSAVWREMKARGLDMTDPKNVEIASAKIRALTGEMNQAGNLAYSQGSLGTITQFLQVPHKVMLSMFTNRKLSGTEQLRYAAANILLYGSVGTVIADAIGADIIPDDPELRYLVTEGAQAFAYNELFRSLTGDDTLEMDFSSFNALNLDGWMKMFMALGKGDVGQVLSQAPAAGLYDPDKGRIALAIKELGRLASFGEKENLPPATAASVMQRVAEISSGFSAYAQAHMNMEAGRRKDARGNPVIGDPTEWQLKLEQFGLKQKSQREYFQLTQLSSLSKKEFEDTVNKDYDYYRRVLNKAAGGTKSEVEEYVEATSFFMSLYKDNPQAMQIINNRMKMDLGDPESKLFRALLSTAGIEDRNTYINRVRMSPLSPEEKELLITRMEQEFPQK